MPRLLLPVPADYLLSRDACSYGYFLLAPNYWHVPTQTLWRILDLPATQDAGGGPVRVSIAQHAASGKRNPARGTPLTVTTSKPLTKAGAASLTAQITRMLRLDELATDIRSFHTLDPRWKRTGAGRLFRSPTLWEDMVKTITSCNVAWPNTMTMNARLCEVFGTVLPGQGHAAKGLSFPTPERIARQKPLTLRVRCRVGYRDTRIVQLARLFVSGKLDTAWYEDPATPDTDLRDALLELPGIGPYAAHNIMQLLGRYGHLPLDSESVRHARTVLGFKGTPKAMMKRLQQHYEPFGSHKFRSYWFELWEFYQSRRGKAHTWDRDTTGRTFTAAMLA